jgi:glutaredoxin
MGQITVFSKSQCPHCIEAKGLLADLEVPFTEMTSTLAARTTSRS